MKDGRVEVADPDSSALCHAIGDNPHAAARALSPLRAAMRLELQLPNYEEGEKHYGFYWRLAGPTIRERLEQDLADALEAYKQEK